MRDRDRCTATVMGGGRGYAVHRCGRRALASDPDGLCRSHRLQQEGVADTPHDEDRWRTSRELEGRLLELSRHLATFYRLPVELEYDEAGAPRACTGRIVVNPEDLLRTLQAQDLMPRRQR
ncbi:hypothetical protein Ga0074812_102444 [Parafrankia irregularis]|uniref:Uncharacterized protein n=1 Tax=Parafrankia irregularis TaxID=795642 RepID=A0A0S4QH33_9ACTN|nr:MULTISPECIES: hypothetical protein [Parafrankia]MBE3202938.1 hypothetical protein [Parafrankia sp. CH37]CUU54434.1 hypothetical protein Ga0074812_102444 [Parafrankia irregularis]